MALPVLERVPLIKLAIQLPPNLRDDQLFRVLRALYLYPLVFQPLFKFSCRARSSEKLFECVHVDGKMSKFPVSKASDFIFDGMPSGELAQVLYYSVGIGAEIVRSILLYPDTYRIIVIVSVSPDVVPLLHNK